MLKRLKIKEKIAFLLFASANPKSKDIQSKRKNRGNGRKINQYLVRFSNN